MISVSLAKKVIHYTENGCSVKQVCGSDTESSSWKKLLLRPLKGLCVFVSYSLIKHFVPSQRPVNVIITIEYPNEHIDEKHNHEPTFVLLPNSYYRNIVIICLYLYGNNVEQKLNEYPSNDLPTASFE